MQKISIDYDHNSIRIHVGDKSFYGSDDVYEFVETFEQVLQELGYEVETEEVY